MKLKKKRKSVRMRGSRTHGWAMKKHKGSGNRGGKGMAGTGKRAGQKKTLIMNLKEEYFGKKGMKGKPKELKVINIRDIEKNIAKMKTNGIAKQAGDSIEVFLYRYKILGDGEIKLKMIIHAKTASISAVEKIEKAGGKIIKEEN